jgi:hypothetical protein
MNFITGQLIATKEINDGFKKALLLQHTAKRIVNIFVAEIKQMLVELLR